MTEEDGEFMLDNFVTFFIAGKFIDLFSNCAGKAFNAFLSTRGCCCTVCTHPS